MSIQLPRAENVIKSFLNIRFGFESMSAIMKLFPSPSAEHFSDGDNLILFDKESDTLLYGHEILRQVLRRGRRQEVLILHVPGEAYIALLGEYFSEVPEVCIYLAESNRLETINPGKGKLLEATSNAIWLDKRHLDILLTVTGTTL
jgi:hypothetical protein